jgi:hypothetical protein
MVSERASAHPTPQQAVAPRAGWTTASHRSGWPGCTVALALKERGRRRLADPAEGFKVRPPPAKNHQNALTHCWKIAEIVISSFDLFGAPVEILLFVKPSENWSE